MTDETPSLAELRRRFEDMREETRRSFTNLGERLDRVPTTDMLTVHLQSTQVQIDLMWREIKRVETDADKRADGIETDLTSLKGDLSANRRFSIATALTAASVLIGLSGFIFTVVAR